MRGRYSPGTCRGRACPLPHLQRLQRQMPGIRERGSGQTPESSSSDEDSGCFIIFSFSSLSFPWCSLVVVQREPPLRLRACRQLLRPAEKLVPHLPSPDRWFQLNMPAYIVNLYKHRRYSRKSFVHICSFCCYISPSYTRTDVGRFFGQGDDTGTLPGFTA